MVHKCAYAQERDVLSTYSTFYRKISFLTATAALPPPRLALPVHTVQAKAFSDLWGYRTFTWIVHLFAALFVC